MQGLTRRGALLGGAALLGGCETVTDAFDRVLGERKVPLPGERRAILQVERPLEADAADRRPVTLPPPRDFAEWPQAGATPNHAPGHPALGGSLREVWRSSAGLGRTYRRRLTAPPILAANTVFAMDAIGTVTAHDAGTGQTRWTLNTRPEKERDGALGGGMAHADGRLYVVTGMSEAMSVDPADGKVGWRVRLPAPARGAPTVAGGRLLVPTIENHLLSLNAADGERQWTYRAQPVTTLALGMPAPAVEGDIVVAGFGSGELTAVRLSDGRPVWSEALASARGGGLADIAAITALPVIDRGRVYAAGLGGLVIAIDLRSGRRLWEREVASGETPWVAGDWVFLMTTGSEVACIGREDGRVRWLTGLDRFADMEKRRDPLTWGPPMLAGGRLLVGGSDGRLLEIDPTSGGTISTTRLSAGALLAPIVVGGTLYMQTEDASVVALRGQA